MPTKALLKRPFDILIVAFFVSHIIITIFVDSQAVLPRRWYSDSARHLLDWYLGAFGDPLVRISADPHLILSCLIYARKKAP